MKDDADLEKRIAQRARHLWEQEGRPAGRDDEFKEKARQLIAIEDNPHEATEPAPQSGTEARRQDAEPVEALENQGEFPALRDQGATQKAPRRPSDQ